MKKNHILYIAAMTILIIWLSLSTTLIVWANSSSVPRKIEFSSMQNELFNDKIEYTPDMTQINSELTQKISFAGWSLISTVHDNSERYTSYILKGQETSYELPLKNVERKEVLSAYPKFSSNGYNLGYAGDFSFLNVKDGTYDLYFYCWENEFNHGMIHTNYQIIKENNEILLRQWNSILVDELKKASGTEQINYSIDNISISEDDFVYIPGWTFIEDLNCTGQSVYIEFTDSNGNKTQFTTRQAKREDVATALHRSDYNLCGFYSSIPISEFSDTVYTMKLIVENGDVIQESTPYTVVMALNDARLEDRVKLFQGTASKISDLKTASNDELVLCSVDHLRIEDEMINIGGWGLIEGLNCETQSIFIEFTDSQGKISQYTANQVARNDVADALSDSDYEQCGYYSYIPAVLIEDGTYTVKIIVENNNIIQESIPYTVDKSRNSIFLKN